jgi:hypothetical protein
MFYFAFMPACNTAQLCKLPKLRAAIMLIVGLLCSVAEMRQAAAVTLVIANGAPQIRLRVGAAGATISLVTFTLTATNAGNGTAINGAPNITIIAEARGPVANARNATLTVNSSAAMISGADSIPMSVITWTTNDAAFPVGTFSGGAGQVLTTFQNSRRRTTAHTFRYANTQIFPSGTYNGQVTYTLSMP